jgi:hypothetical protein
LINAQSGKALRGCLGAGIVDADIAFEESHQEKRINGFLGRGNVVHPCSVDAMISSPSILLGPDLCLVEGGLICLPPRNLQRNLRKAVFSS